MQEALKNPHFKKIWGKVIMNNNPTAKSLEEAFRMEKGLCEYKIEIAEINPQNVDNSIPREMLPILFNEAGVMTEYTHFKTSGYGCDGYSYKMNGTIWKMSFYQYLGKPITLFDVLSLLNKGKILEETQYISNGNKIFKVCFDDNYNEFFCDFNTNLLEEQTPETWEKIANLI